ncbi:hypothetical protein M0R19_02035 [Candidatus Pacearchaeota archaeon]|nr:hypothetical protein [Candidatus Pacearchaeota archaeon]
MNLEEQDYKEQFESLINNSDKDEDDLRDIKELKKANVYKRKEFVVKSESDPRDYY